MNTLLIRLFSGALIESNKVDAGLLNKKAMSRGYFVHPDVCNTSTEAFIDSIDVNFNTTFYKTWNDITSRSRWELAFHQILHYTSTYGTDFTEGNGFTMNDNEEPLNIDFKAYKVIMPMSETELYKRCLGMLTAGIALNDETMKAVTDYVIAIHKIKPNDYPINIDSIANKEAMCYICDQLNILPSNGSMLIRYIIGKTTGNYMVIKNKAAIESIKASYMPFQFVNLAKPELEKIAAVFFRYKDLILAFKHNRNMKIGTGKVINKLRKMANEFHKPMVPSFWSGVLSKEYTPDVIDSNLSSLNAFKTVSLMQACLVRMTKMDKNLYVIRNGKTFIKDNTTNTSNDYCLMLYNRLRQHLVALVAKNANKTDANGNILTDEDGNPIKKTVKLNAGVNVVMPSSEKAFIGNYPMGTSYPLNEHNYVGIYWRNEWGVRDYDLSALDIERRTKIGWNGSYYNDNYDIVFSGDMTNAEPEATEVLYFKKGAPDCIIYNNIFSKSEYSSVIKYRLFVGQENIQNLTKSYMVDPANIKLNVDITMPSNICQHMPGVIVNNVLYLTAINNVGTSVSRISPIEEERMKIFKTKLNCYVSANDIFKDAGFNIVTEGDADIDFINLDKDSLISVMS